LVEPEGGVARTGPRATNSYSMLRAPTVANCPGCPYRAEGPAIGSRGDIRSPLLLVAEAPGVTEIDCGRPFVGPAGDLLRAAMGEAGLEVVATRLSP
jgi:Uracil-DNA glycosylase